MERNADYFKDGFKGDPTISKIKFRTIKDANTRAAELMTGAIDWIWDVPKDQAERIQANPAHRGRERQDAARLLPAVRCAGRVGPEVLHRQARAPGRRARHRPRVAHQEPGRPGLGGRRTPPAIPTSSRCSGDVTKYAYDPAKAKALLKEAGFPDGFEFDLYAYRDREFTEAVIGDLAKVGIRPKLNYLQYTAFLENVRKGQHAGRARHLGLQLGPRRLGHDGAFLPARARRPHQGPRGQEADRGGRLRSPIPTSARRPGRRRWRASPPRPSGCRSSPTPSTTRSPRTSTSCRPPTRSRSSSRRSGSEAAQQPRTAGACGDRSLDARRSAAAPPSEARASTRGTAMLAFTLKRLGVALLVALTVSLITFSMIYVSGDPAIAIAGEGARAAGHRGDPQVLRLRPADHRAVLRLAGRRAAGRLRPLLHACASRSPT